MTKLETLYASIKGLQDLGLPLNEETLKAADELEEQLIKTEILPAMSKDIEPMLSQIQRELVLVVEYKPGTPISVALSRKTNIAELLDAKKLESDLKADDTYTNNEDTELPSTGITRMESIGFSVRFPDGTVISEKDAKDTMISALRKIGLERVSKFKGRLFVGYPLVGREKRTDGTGRWQERVDGWYIYTNMSNDTKMRMLKMISDEFGLSLSIKTEEGIEYESTLSRDPNTKHRARFSLNGKGFYNKRDVVLKTIKQYLELNPHTTYSQLKEAFPNDLQGSYGVFKKVSWIEQQHSNGHDHRRRYFMDEQDLLTTSDGILIAISTQWGDQFPRFTRRAKDLGLIIEEVSRNEK